MGNEVAQEVPQVQMVEVFKQTANATAQRIVQTGVQYERAVGREQILERVEGATIAGVYEPGVVAVRDNALVQPTVVERISPVMTGGEMMVAPTTLQQEYIQPEMIVAETVPTTFVQ